MHKIFELKEMGEEQLREIAAGLKIKGAKKMTKDELVYDILDAEAVIDSQKEPEKQKRRGRQSPTPLQRLRPVMHPQQTQMKSRSQGAAGNRNPRSRTQRPRPCHRQRRMILRPQICR